MRVILASSSPRRREILNLIGLKNFEVFPPKVREVKVKGPSDVKLNAHLKAKAAFKTLNPKGETVIIASDTAVLLEGRFLGKPKDRNEARSMLLSLSGRWHTVYTSLAVLYLKGKSLRGELSLHRTRVKFKKLSPEEVEWYLNTGEPLDKAAAYGIQGYGAIFIERLVGDYFTVMGLPASGLYESLKKLLGEKAVLKLLS